MSTGPEAFPDRNPSLELSNLDRLPINTYTALVRFLDRAGVEYCAADEASHPENPAFVPVAFATLDDLHLFGAAEGHDERTAARVWSVLDDHAVRLDIETIAEYQRPAPTKSSWPLFMVRQKPPPGRNPDYPTDEYQLDVPSLGDTLELWFDKRRYPRTAPVQGLGAMSLSLLADFANHMLRPTMPFPVLPRK